MEQKDISRPVLLQVHSCTQRTEKAIQQITRDGLHSSNGVHNFTTHPERQKRPAAPLPEQALLVAGTASGRPCFGVMTAVSSQTSNARI